MLLRLYFLQYFSTNFFLGYPTYRWNPHMYSYIAGRRKGWHIFKLDSNWFHTRRAFSFIKGVTLRYSYVLYSGAFGEDTTLKNVLPRWLPGLLTNLRFYNLSLVPFRLRTFPDVLVSFSLEETNQFVLQEALKLRLPLVSHVDSIYSTIFAMFPIPVNSGSSKSTTYFYNLFLEATDLGLIVRRVRFFSWVRSRVNRKFIKVQSLLASSKKSIVVRKTSLSSSRFRSRAIRVFSIRGRKGLLRYPFGKRIKSFRFCISDNQSFLYIPHFLSRSVNYSLKKLVGGRKKRIVLNSRKVKGKKRKSLLRGFSRAPLRLKTRRKILMKKSLKFNRRPSRFHLRTRGSRLLYLRAALKRIRGVGMKRFIRLCLRRLRLKLLSYKNGGFGRLFRSHFRKRFVKALCPSYRAARMKMKQFKRKHKRRYYNLIRSRIALIGSFATPGIFVSRYTPVFVSLKTKKKRLKRRLFEILRKERGVVSFSKLKIVNKRLARKYLLKRKIYLKLPSSYKRLFRRKSRYRKLFNSTKTYRRYRLAIRRLKRSRLNRVLILRRDVKKLNTFGLGLKDRFLRLRVNLLRYIVLYNYKLSFVFAVSTIFSKISTVSNYSALFIMFAMVLRFLRVVARLLPFKAFGLSKLRVKKKVKKARFERKNKGLRKRGRGEIPNLFKRRLLKRKARSLSLFPLKRRLKRPYKALLVSRRFEKALVPARKEVLKRRLEYMRTRNLRRRKFFGKKRSKPRRYNLRFRKKY